MSFRENLKDELAYQDITVKELSFKTGINKRTLDNYLRENESQPTIENAVKIAKALGVSAEYLATGEQPTKLADNSSTQPSLDLKLCKKYYSTIQKLNEMPDNTKNLLCKLISEWKEN